MSTHHRDFRSLSEDAQAEVRRCALRDTRSGDGVHTIAKRYSIHYQTVYDWRRKEKELKTRDFKGEVRGREKDVQKLITPAWEKRLLTTIEQKTPEQCGIHATLWDRRAIQELVKKKTKITITLRRVSVYTGRWNLTPQRPMKYAAEQDPQKIQKWLRYEYPRIKARAQREKAEIHWEDETGVALSTHYARGYAPKGHTPILRASTKRARISMISSITNRGDIRFMLYQKTLRAPLFLTFLKRLVQGATKKIFLITDNLQVHKAASVRQWVRTNHESIELFFPTTVRTTVQP
jgi:transposase